MLNSPKQSLKPDILRLCDLRGDQPDNTGATGIFSFGWGNDQFLANVNDSYSEFQGDFIGTKLGLYRYEIPSTIKTLKIWIVGDGTSEYCSTVGEDFPDFCGITCPIDSECCSDLGVCCYGSGGSVGCTGPVSADYCVNTLSGNHYNGIKTCQEAGPTFCTEGQHCCAKDPEEICNDCFTCYNCDNPLCGGKTCLNANESCDCNDTGCGCGPCCTYDSGGFPTGCDEQAVGCPDPVESCDECTKCKDGTGYGYCCQGDSGGDVSCSGSKVCGSECGEGGKIVASCDDCTNDGMKYDCFSVPNGNPQCFGTWNGGSDSCPTGCDGGGGGGGNGCYQCVNNKCETCNIPAGEKCPAFCGPDVCTPGLPCFTANLAAGEDNADYMYAVANDLRFDSSYFTTETQVPTSLLFGTEGVDYCDICSSTNREAYIREQEIKCPASSPGAIELQYDLSNLCLDDKVEIELDASDNYLEIRVYVTWDKEEERVVIFRDRIPRGFTRYPVLGNYDCDNCEFDIFCRLPRTEEGLLMIQRYEFYPSLSEIDPGPGPILFPTRYNATRTVYKDPKEVTIIQPAVAIGGRPSSSTAIPLPTTARSITSHITAITRDIKNDVYRIDGSGRAIQVADAPLGTPNQPDTLMNRVKTDLDIFDSSNFGASSLNGDYMGLLPFTWAGEYGTPGTCQGDPAGSGFIGVIGRSIERDPNW
jgi:hypothetical protein